MIEVCIRTFSLAVVGLFWTLVLIVPSVPLALSFVWMIAWQGVSFGTILVTVCLFCATIVSYIYLGSFLKRKHLLCFSEHNKHVVFVTSMNP
jgi:hypothetical protein